MLSPTHTTPARPAKQLADAATQQELVAVERVDANCSPLVFEMPAAEAVDATCSPAQSFVDVDQLMQALASANSEVAQLTECAAQVAMRFHIVRI